MTRDAGQPDGSDGAPTSAGRSPRLSARAALAAVVVSTIGAGALTLSVGAPAASAAGDCPNAELRQGLSAHLPGCRAFELVSPVDFSGSPAGIDSSALPYPGLAGESGDRVLYGAVASVGETTNGALNPMIFGRRTAQGWTARTAMRSTDDGETPLEYLTTEPRYTWATPDVSDMVFWTSKSLGPPNVTPGNLIPVYGIADGGLPRWLSEPDSGYPVATTGASNSLMASRDLSTVVFNSGSRLATDQPSGSTGGIYAYRDGRLQLASVLPNGLAAQSPAIPAPSTAASAPMSLAFRNAVSADGSKLLFVDGPVSARDGLYVRDLDAGVTRKLTSAPVDFQSSWPPFMSWSSPWQRSVGPGFVSASADGSVAYFRSAENLAPGASGSLNNKVYRADLTTGDVTYAAELNGPPVGMSEDGDRVLFLRPPATAGESWTIRYWDAATPTVSTSLGTTAGQIQTNSVRTSNDGRTWVFTSTGSLDPARLPVDETKLQVYRWTVGAANPTCLSCTTTDGATRLGGANLSQAEGEATEGLKNPNGLNNTPRRTAVAQPSRAISDDGTRVAFDSPDRLVPEDRNDVRDVYVWDANAAPGGQLALVTTGSAQSTSASYFIDMSPTGDDLFFATQASLVPTDVDGAYDVYDARVGGGFAEASTEPCLADGCRTAETGRTPELPTAGTPAFVGGGNVLESPVSESASVSVSRVKTARGVKAKVRVKVSGSGRIKVFGSGLARAAKKTTKAKTYTVTVKLSERAQRTLRRKHRVKVRMTVQFVPQKGRSAVKRVQATFASTAKAKGGR